MGVLGEQSERVLAVGGDAAKGTNNIPLEGQKPLPGGPQAGVGHLHLGDAKAPPQRQREALLAAVAPPTAEWSPVDRAVAASMLDVLWGVMSYERMVVDWGLEPKDAIRGIAWVIGLVEDAIREGRGPGA